jgi:hypothetical protein
MPRSSMFCDHANECPAVCPCDSECACKETMCQDFLVAVGSWLRQEDGMWFRVANVDPGLLTCFNYQMDLFKVTPDRYRREGFTSAVLNPAGTEFSPFRDSSVPWIRQRSLSVQGVCNVEGCGRPATEGWVYTTRPSSRYAPALRTTWSICQEHWFFPNSYQKALTDWGPEESWVSDMDLSTRLELIRRSVERIAPPTPPPPPPDSDISIFDAILDDD